MRLAVPIELRLVLQQLVDLALQVLELDEREGLAVLRSPRAGEREPREPREVAPLQVAR